MSSKNGRLCLAPTAAPLALRFAGTNISVENAPPNFYGSDGSKDSTRSLGPSNRMHIHTVRAFFAFFSDSVLLINLVKYAPGSSSRFVDARQQEQVFHQANGYPDSFSRFHRELLSHLTHISSNEFLILNSHNSVRLLIGRLYGVQLGQNGICPIVSMK